MIRPLAAVLILSLGSSSSAFSAAAEQTGQHNVLLEESTLPLHYPPFDRIVDRDFAPAFDAGMAQELLEIDAIANDPAAANFDNTIVELELSGTLLKRVTTVFFALNGADTNDERKRLQAEYAPRFAAHQDAIWLNATLFARIRTLYDQRHALNLDAESLRLLEKYYTDFVRAGALLSAADQQRLKAMNAALASLATRFNQNVLAEVNASSILIEDADELEGLSDDQIAAAAEAASAQAMPGRYLIALVNTTSQPLLAQLRNRKLRQRVFETSIARGSQGDEYDNRQIVSRIMQLRAERAQLLGYPDHATYALELQTAATPDAVDAMLSRLAPAAVANATREAAVLQAMIDREQIAIGEPSFKLQPWDWPYYSEKVRQARYDFDESQLQPYLELHNVLENGVFYAAGQLYGLRFNRRTDLPVYHDDILVYDVIDADGEPLAIFIADMYARPSKRGGAWASAYVSQSLLTGDKPVIANHLNIPRPPSGQPTLLTWDQVTTAFHEFGHALHGMFSNVRYPSFAGTRVPRDFVEFPSQVNEMWASWPSVLQRYARHYQTGAPMPQDLLEKVIATAQFNQGFATTEYLESALLDQRWHRLSPGQVPAAAAVAAFEQQSLKDDGVLYVPVPPRYRTTYFSHIMGGYAAGYYAYIWAEVLDADTVEWFMHNGGLTRANGDHFRKTLLSRGGSEDAMRLFENFTGHAPRMEPLLQRRGLETQHSE